MAEAWKRRSAVWADWYDVDDDGDGGGGAEGGVVDLHIVERGGGHAAGDVAE